MTSKALEYLNQAKLAIDSAVVHDEPSEQPLECELTQQRVTRHHFRFAIEQLAQALGRTDVANLEIEILVAANEDARNPRKQ